MTLMDRYAELIVRVGANVQPGQEVWVTGDVAHLPVVRAVVQRAWAAGASRVDVDFADGPIRRAGIDSAPMESLTSVPPWRMDRLRHYGEVGGATIRLTGEPDPHVFDGVDPARAAAVPVEYAQENRRLTLGGLVAWTIVAAPNPGWARQVFGEPDVDRLWEAVTGPLRLDAPDVVAAWREHAATLAARGTALEALELDAVRYVGGGTDLTVGLVPGCRWISGAMRTRSGIEFLPNLPTEEVFTSPDRRRADGVLCLTRPLVMPRTGVLVEGLVLEFAAGAIVSARATRGQDAVEAELALDGARSLGEVSLVDGSSPVRAAGVIFHDTLYDENAGCHVAWGQSFPFAVDGGIDTPSDELFERGLNRAPVHTDVVVGGPEVSVVGLRPDGSAVDLIRDDVWVLPV